MLLKSQYKKIIIIITLLILSGCSNNMDGISKKNADYYRSDKTINIYTCSKKICEKCSVNNDKTENEEQDKNKDCLNACDPCQTKN